jgi:hypothetical protein
MNKNNIFVIAKTSIIAIAVALGLNIIYMTTFNVYTSIEIQYYPWWMEVELQANFESNYVSARF